MKEKVFLFYDKFFSGAFILESVIISFIGIFLVFLLNLSLSIFLKNYAFKNKISTSAISLVFCCLLLPSVGGGNVIAFFISVSLVYALNSITFFIRVKKKKEQKEDAIKIEKREVFDYKFSPIIEKIREVEKLESVKETSPQPRKEKTDFSHVKSVIERLENFPLSTSDRKQIKELENAIILIENGTEDDYSINDELGALLKIMAKYGV